MYTLGLVSISFRGYSPAEILQSMSACGLSHIEWGSDVHVPPHKAEEIAALQREYGVSCCSYGTYFRLGVTPIEELLAYITAAKQLGTHILRLWCGNQNSELYTLTEKEQLFSACRAAAKLAAEQGMILCMECHNNTYTNRKEAALELMQAINAPQLRMYWQPFADKTAEENEAYATALAPYTVNVHVFNWNGAERYPLAEAHDAWRRYLTCFQKDVALLLEFMPDDKLETLPREVTALREIVR